MLSKVAVAEVGVDATSEVEDSAAVTVWLVVCSFVMLVEVVNCSLAAVVSVVASCVLEDPEKVSVESVGLVVDCVEVTVVLSIVLPVAEVPVADDVEPVVALSVVTSVEAAEDRGLLSKEAVAEVGVDATSEVEDCVVETVVDDVSVLLSVEVTEVVLAAWLEIGVDAVSVV